LRVNGVSDVVLGLLGTELGICDFEGEIEGLYEGYRERGRGGEGEGGGGGGRGRRGIEWKDYDYSSGNVNIFFFLMFIYFCSWWKRLEG
jgi:hypothetical protein